MYINVQISALWTDNNKVVSQTSSQRSQICHNETAESNLYKGLKLFKELNQSVQTEYSLFVQENTTIFHWICIYWNENNNFVT